MKDIYTVAGQNAELLDWIPCYCGCGESVGHKNNKNCFIREIKKNGEVVWDCPCNDLRQLPRNRS